MQVPIVRVLVAQALIAQVPIPQVPTAATVQYAETHTLSQYEIDESLKHESGSISER